MKHIQGFTRCHWMLQLPLVECMRRIGIAPAAIMVMDYDLNTHNTTKTPFIASNYITN
jgi:hypothetical protein